AKAALLQAAGLSEADFAAAAGRLHAGEHPSQALDDCFVQAFAIAGTAEDALAQARRYGQAGASELVLTFAGWRAEADMQYLANAARRSGWNRTEAKKRAAPLRRPHRINNLPKAPRTRVGHQARHEANHGIAMRAGGALHQRGFGSPR